VTRAGLRRIWWGLGTERVGKRLPRLQRRRPSLDPPLIGVCQFLNTKKQSVVLETKEVNVRVGPVLPHRSDFLTLNGDSVPLMRYLEPVEGNPSAYSLEWARIFRTEVEKYHLAYYQ